MFFAGFFALPVFIPSESSLSVPARPYRPSPNPSELNSLLENINIKLSEIENDISAGTTQEPPQQGAGMPGEQIDTGMDAGRRFEEFERQINDSMSLSRYDEALNLSRELLRQFPENKEAEKLADRVRNESEKFVSKQTERMVSKIRLYAEKRQWKNALEIARELIEKYPDSRQAGEVKVRMSAIIDNTRLEEVRELRDRILELMDRRRYNEALELSVQVVGNYPETAAAAELRAQMPTLRELAANYPR